jgi:ribosome-associated protein
MSRDSLRIIGNVCIPLSEISFTADKSSGPGGQHVNKTSSRITLWFNVEDSAALEESEKDLLRAKLASRIGRDGRLSVVCQETRSQKANKEAALYRFVELLRRALAAPKPRRRTFVPLAAKRRRLAAKRRRAELKRERARPARED